MTKKNKTTEIENIFKAHALCQSRDITRQPLLFTKIEFFKNENFQRVKLVTTDGTILLYHEVDKFELSNYLRNFNIHLNDMDNQDHLFRIPAKYKDNLLNFYSCKDKVYPKWQNVVPNKFPCPVDKKPMINTELCSIFHKIKKILGVDSLLSYHHWVTEVSATIFKFSGNDFALIMPCRTDSSFDYGKEITNFTIEN